MMFVEEEVQVLGSRGEVNQAPEPFTMLVWVQTRGAVIMSVGYSSKCYSHKLSLISTQVSLLPC